MPAIGGQPRRGARRQRVGARLRLGERVRADQLGARQPRQVTGFLLLGAEVHDRERPDGGVRAQRPGKRRIRRDLLADVRRADLVEPETAVGLGDLEPGQIERRGLAQQLAREIPVVRVELLLARQHLVAHELGRGLAEEPLLVAEVFAREDIAGVERLGQEPPAPHRVLDVSAHSTLRLTGL